MAYQYMVLRQFSQAQLYGLVGLGTMFWGAAALTVRHFGHILFTDDLRRFTSYAASIPILYGAMRFSEVLLNINPPQRLTATTIMTATALVLDGTAFMWFPALYENPLLKKTKPQLAIEFSRMGAAWILCGAGMGLFVAMLTY